MSRSIITINDPVKRSSLLRKVCQPVKKIDSQIKDLAAEMLALAGGDLVGLAAPQVGELLQVIVIDVQGLKKVLINPQLIKTRGQHWVQETCASIPRKLYWVKRPKLVKLTALDLSGQVISIKGHELLASVLQHEYDHLQGIMIDKIGRIDFSRSNEP